TGEYVLTAVVIDVTNSESMSLPGFTNQVPRECGDDLSFSASRFGVSLTTRIDRYGSFLRREFPDNQWIGFVPGIGNPFWNSVSIKIVHEAGFILAEARFNEEMFRPLIALEELFRPRVFVPMDFGFEE